MKPLSCTLALLVALLACNLPAAASSASKTSEVLETSEVSTPRGYITFAVNVHDWVHGDESAATLLRLIDIFKRYGVRGDFYLTAPVTRQLAENHPEVIQRLKESDMTISYHVRAPHPLVSGFSTPLEGLEGEALLQAIREYETCRLDMATGGLDCSQQGGYAYVAEVFGTKPVVASAGGEARLAAAARQVYAEMGAQMTVVYHESGSKIDQPFEYLDGLLIRPVDFSATRLTLENGGQNFWWNLIGGKRAAEADPITLIQNGLAAWEAQNPPRPPFIITHIHENNFYRPGSAAWGSYYYQIDEHGNKTTPLSPPFDLSAPDPSTPRSAEEQEAIWQAYEAMVAWAAENLQVVTSEDIVQMAQGAVLPAEVPTVLSNMLQANPSGKTYYIAPEQPGASDDNDGLAPEVQGDRHGPWASLAALRQHNVKLAPGDTLILRQGIYPTGEDTLNLAIQGTAESPIRIAAYPGEQPVLRGGYDPADWSDLFQNPDSSQAREFARKFKEKPILRLTGSYLILEGLRIEGCYMACIHLQGDHIILMNNQILGSIEDGIKSSYPAQMNLIYANEFSGFGDQAIDVWGTRDTYIVANEFHHSNQDLPWGVGAPVWTKGGSEGIYYLENAFHDLQVKDHALNLGGCCWYNWAERSRDAQGNLLPVARHVYAYRNTFENVTIAAETPDRFPGVIGVEGCQECAASQNIIRNSDDAFGIHATAAEGQRVPPVGITLTGNAVENPRSGGLYNLVHDAADLTIDQNTYHSDLPLTCRIQDRELTPEAWLNEGYDLNSVWP